jgi:hypothetical protein
MFGTLTTPSFSKKIDGVFVLLAGQDQKEQSSLFDFSPAPQTSSFRGEGVLLTFYDSSKFGKKL